MIIDPNQTAMHLEQLAVLSSRGVDVSDLLLGLAKLVRGTHEPSPNGLVEVTPTN